MKSIIVLLLFSLILFSCSTNSAHFVPSKADTIRMLGVYVDLSTKEVLYAPLYRITKDSLKWVNEDSLTQKKRVSRDTTIYIPISYTDSTKKDSTGKYLKKITYLPTFKEAVSTNINMDTAVAILGRWVEAHKEYWAVDSTKKSK